MTPIPIVGAGGIGTAVGYALTSAGVPVVMVEANPTKRAAGTLTVAGRPPVRVPFADFESWHPSVGAVVLLCVKCYDNPAVLDRLELDTVLLPIQNGFDPALEAFGPKAEGIASFVSECSKTECVTRITRPGELHIGPRPGHGLPPGVADLLPAFRASKLFRVVQVPDVLPIKHTKLMYNAAISPVAAAAGIDNGDLLLDRDARRIFFALLQENYRILTAAGIKLGKVGPFHPGTVANILRRPWLAKLLAKHFARSLRGTYCSMAGEIETGRTELPNYTGHLLRLADGKCDAPLNRAIFERVSAMTIPDRGVLQEWSALVSAMKI